MTQISLLLGSGFSAPDGVKTVWKINEEFKNLKVDDIYIHSSMTFILMKDGKKPDDMSRHWADELFFVEFVKFYTDFTQKDFHYEDFYDFVISFGRFDKNRQAIEAFYEKFKTDTLHNPKYPDNIESFVGRFTDYFNQFLSSLLNSKKYYADVSLGNYPSYDEFIYFLRTCLDEETIINVHSLNHDLLFEHLASKHDYLWQHYCDGFADNGSNYYGEVNLSESITKTYKVRLKCFQNLYDKNLRLYKLHGSIDTYVANIDSRNLDLTRVKKDWGVGNVLKEVNEDGRLTYSNMYQNSYPELLSGASTKHSWYDQPYYAELISAFKENLHNSDKLIVIGYGFNDDGINRIMESDFLQSGKQVIVVDIRKPTHRFIDYYPVKVIEKSLADVTIEDWMAVREDRL